MIDSLPLCTSPTDMISTEGPERPADLVVRDVSGPAEMRACQDLYSEVMNLSPADGNINPRLLIALQHNGGYVIGAFEAEQLIGFTYSFLAREPQGCIQGNGRSPLYQYSQLAVVSHRRQGEGIGRRLKRAQRDRALSDGISTLRWAFDPLKTRNAHFNLDTLGAVVTRFVPAMYGVDGFGADSGEETDRFIADWDLTQPVEPTPRPIIPQQDWHPGKCVPDGDDVLVAAPAQWDFYRAEVGSAAAAKLRRQICASFAAALDSGRAGVSCQRTGPDIAVYRFSPDHGRTNGLQLSGLQLSGFQLHAPKTAEGGAGLCPS